MKKTLSFVVQVVTTIAITFLINKWWDSRDDYRTIGRTTSRGGAEYSFLGAAWRQSPFSNDVAAVTALLDAHSIPYVTEEPDVIEIRVPKEQERRARALFASDSRGLIYPPSQRPPHYRLSRLVLFLIFLPVFLGIWMFDRRIRRKQKEAIEQMLADATSKSARSAASEASDA